MNGIHSEPLRITGIVLSLLGLGLLARPLISQVIGTPQPFRFFSVVPDGVPALIACGAVLLLGLVLLSITRPLNEESRDRRR